MSTKNVLGWFGFVLIVCALFVAVIMLISYKPCGYKVFTVKVTKIYPPVTEEIFGQIKKLDPNLTTRELTDKIDQNIIAIKEVLASTDFSAYNEIHKKEKHGVGVYTFPEEQKGQEYSFFLVKKYKVGDYISQCIQIYVTSEDVITSTI